MSEKRLYIFSPSGQVRGRSVPLDEHDCATEAATIEIQAGDFVRLAETVTQRQHIAEIDVDQIIGKGE